MRTYYTKITMLVLILSFLLLFENTNSNENNELMYNKKEKINSDTLPSDFPLPEVTISNNPSPGYFFLANRQNSQDYGKYMMILGNDGKPYNYKSSVNRLYDFKVQNNGLFSVQKAIKSGGIDIIAMLMDTAFAIVDSFSMKNEFQADMHEFIVLPNGNVILTAMDPRWMDLSSIIDKGEPNVNVSGSVIQELDHEKNVVFQWQSWDFIDINDTYEKTLHSGSFVYAYINAIDIDNDGNYIVSLRHACQIIKINRTSGEIMWRLGGKKNQFEFINDYKPSDSAYFSHQHHIQRLPNGNIIFFDNGWIRDPQFSRAVEYKIDESNFLAEKVWEYRHEPDYYVELMGSVQRLSNGNTIIGWGGPGSYPSAFSEIDSNKNVLFDASLPSGVSSYRVFKHQIPIGQPSASVQKRELLKLNTYSFDNKSDSTGVKMTVNFIEGYMYNDITINRYDWAPLNPEFIGAVPHIYPYRYTLTGNEIDSLITEIKVNLKYLPRITNPEYVIIYFRKNIGQGIFRPLQTEYDGSTKSIKTTIDGFGEIVFGFPYPDILPPAPSLFQPIDNQIVEVGKTLRLFWNPNGYFNKCRIQIAEDEEFQNSSVDTIISATYYYLDGLTDQSKYYWRVKSINEHGESAWSGIHIFETSLPYLKIKYPIGGECLTIDSTMKIIRWETNSQDTIKIELLKNDQIYKLIEDSVTNTTGAFGWIIPETIPEDSTYKIRITSVADGELLSESPENFTIKKAAIGVEEFSGNMIEIINYPNPFDESTTFKFNISKAGLTTLKLYTVEGREYSTIFSEFLDSGEYSKRWSSALIAPGIYFYRLSSGVSVKTGKLIIFH
ncbi:aryl-sulfate sulfotransferase [Bacteroidota bacterium]